MRYCTIYLVNLSTQLLAEFSVFDLEPVWLPWDAIAGDTELMKSCFGIDEFRIAIENYSALWNLIVDSIHPT